MQLLACAVYTSVKLKGEVARDGRSKKYMHARVVGIIRYIVHPYCFSLKWYFSEKQ